jgi:hypothetical protein
MKTKRRKERSLQLSLKPMHEKLPWPGLKAGDRVSRIVTRAVKEAKEAREREVWAEEQIARVLDHIPPEAALKLVFHEMSRRGKHIPRFAMSPLKILQKWNLKPRRRRKSPLVAITNCDCK